MPTFRFTEVASQAPSGSRPHVFSFGTEMPMVPVAYEWPLEQGDVDRAKWALKQLESAHDPYAHNPTGCNHGRRGRGCFGLYQFGHLAALDVGITDPRVFLGNAELAEWAAQAWIDRYARWHRYEPAFIAIQWKTGPTGMRKIREAVDAGTPFPDAVRQHGHPGQPEYSRRFAAAWEKAPFGNVQPTA